MKTSEQPNLGRRTTDVNVWLESASAGQPKLTGEEFKYHVLDSEDAVGEAMLRELLDYADSKSGDINIILLGGRGAQAMYRKIRERITTGERDDLLSRLNVFYPGRTCSDADGERLEFRTRFRAAAWRRVLCEDQKFHADVD